jgi:hypothetical protein
MGAAKLAATATIASSALSEVALATTSRAKIKDFHMQYILERF